MITLEEANEILRQNIKPIKDIEKCRLLDATERILEEDLVAKFDNPPFSRSPLDGYAVRAEDILNASKDYPVKLKIIDEIMAGEVSKLELKPGQAVRIMTGAPIPNGADTVVKQEDTDCASSVVKVYKPIKSYENYCYRGEDFLKGDCLISKGERMDSINIGIAASMGYGQMLVRRQPSIAVLTTGSELQDPGTEIKCGQIYDSNRFLVSARLRELGIEPTIVEHIEDDPEKMANRISEIADDVDLIITTGGVSVGKKDIIHDVIKILEANQLFWRVDIKPGSPVMASIYRDKCIISLSGNPFGVAVGMEILVRPIISMIEGDFYLEDRRQGIMMQEFSKISNSRRYIRAIYKNDITKNTGEVFLSGGTNASGVLSTMKECNCLIEIPSGNQGLKKEDTVEVILF